MRFPNAQKEALRKYHIPTCHPYPLLSPWTCFKQQNEKSLVGKAGRCIRFWLYCFVIISREIENVIMIMKLNCNLPTGATKLFVAPFHPNSLNCSLPRGGGALTALGCLHCVPAQAILAGTC